MNLDVLIQPLDWFITQFVNPNKRLFVGYLLIAIAFAWFSFYKINKSTNKRFIRFILPRSLWLHKSAKLDYAMWCINMLIKTLLIVPLLFASAPIAIGVLQTLEFTFGDIPNISQDRAIIMICFTLIMFVLDDFSRFLLHWMMHKIPTLWHIHKVHHSANVLTPVTVYRTHPIESMLYTCRLLLTHGVAIGIGFYLFGHKLAVIDIAGANLGVFMFNIMASNLRHSHIWLSWGDKFESWFVSPAQHQIHHSTDPKHFDKNFGSALAVWDKLFKTHVLASSVTKPLRFGLGSKTSRSYRSLAALYWLPIKQIYLGLLNLVKRDHLTK